MVIISSENSSGWDSALDAPLQTTLESCFFFFIIVLFLFFPIIFQLFFCCFITFHMCCSGARNRLFCTVFFPSLSLCNWVWLTRSRDGPMPEFVLPNNNNKLYCLIDLIRALTLWWYSSLPLVSLWMNRKKMTAFIYWFYSVSESCARILQRAFHPLKTVGSVQILFIDWIWSISSVDFSVFKCIYRLSSINNLIIYYKH